MAKPSITTRATKGSALSWTEGDQNLENLRDATVTIKAGTGGTDVVSDLNGTVTLVAGTNISLSGDNTAKTVTINSTASGGITDVVQDTTPQLGGNLDVNGNKIVSVSNADITIEPNGTGKVVVAGDLQINGTTTTINATNLDVSDKNITIAKGSADASAANGAGITVDGAGATITYDSSDKWVFNKPIQTSNLKITTNEIQAMNADGNIALTPDGTGKVKIDWAWFPNTDGSSNQVLKTDGSGNLSFGSVPAPTLDGLDGVTLSAPTNGQVLSYNSTSGEWTNSTISGGASTLNDLTDVNTAGASNQQLLSYNSSTSSWEPRTVTAGISAVISDTTPSLGGNLNVNGNQIVSSSNGNITLAPNGTGKVVLSGNQFPNVTGSNGQVLSTNGSGTLSWISVSGGLPMAFYTISSIIGTDNNTGFEVDSTDSWTSRYNSASITVPSAGQFTLPAGNWLITWNINTITSSGTGTSTWAVKNSSTYVVQIQNSLSAGAYIGQTYNGYVSLGSTTTLQIRTNRTGNTPKTAVGNVLQFIKLS